MKKQEPKWRIVGTVALPAELFGTRVRKRTGFRSRVVDTLNAAPEGHAVVIEFGTRTRTANAASLFNLAGFGTLQRGNRLYVVRPKENR